MEYEGRVPFTVEVSIAEVVQGVFEIEGAFYYADEALVVEYQTKGFGKQMNPEEPFRLPLDALDEVALKGVMLGARVVVRPKRLTTLAQVPWTCRDAVVFRVKHPHRRRAEVLVSYLQQRLAEGDEEAGVSIPFQLPSANLGFTEIGGLLSLDAEFLVFEVGTGMPGGAKRDPQTIKIEPQALASIWLERGLVTDKLVVRPKTRALFEAMPGMYKDKAELTLTISRKFREDTERLVDEADARRRAAA